MIRMPARPRSKPATAIRRFASPSSPPSRSPAAGQAEPAATTVPAAAAYSRSPFWGVKLSRDQALAHPRIDEFWQIVD
jgi:hypothetical protein